MPAPVRFAGSFTALVTPFQSDGSLDLEALDRLVEAQIEGGISGLVPCGTTGETPCLTAAEQLEVIARVARTAGGRVPVVAGTGSNDTARSVAHSRAALKAGADAVMVVMPYYNKPSQAGMRAHVLAVAGAVDAEVLVYNIPGRSVVDLDVATLASICDEAANVVAIKDATGNVARCQETKRRLGDRIAVMSGDDALTLGMMACGASGVVSVTGNVLPRRVVAITEKLAAGDLEGARRAHLALLPFHRAMFVEPNPAPAKAALAALGRMSATVRAPMIPVGDTTEAQLRSLLAELGAL